MVGEDSTGTPAGHITVIPRALWTSIHLFAPAQKSLGGPGRKRKACSNWVMFCKGIAGQDEGELLGTVQYARVDNL